jgi:hypothetical protein
MGRYDSHESYVHTNYYLECPSWCHCQPYHLPPSCRPSFVPDAHDNLGEFLR